MKTNLEMPRPNSEEALLTFQDVAACFSEEEWKLLHKWQKELYNNVMKDIHQVLTALGPHIIILAKSEPGFRVCAADGFLGIVVVTLHHISRDLFVVPILPVLCPTVTVVDTKEVVEIISALNPSRAAGLEGPLIANSIFSIGAKEKENLRHHNSETRYGINHNTSDALVNSDDSYGLNRQEHLFLKDSRSMDRREHRDSLSTGYPMLSFDTVLREEQDCESSLIRHQSTDVGENRTDPSSGIMDIASIISFTIKEENDNYFMKSQDSEMGESSLGATEFPFLNAKTLESLEGHQCAIDEERNIGFSSGLATINPVTPFRIKKEQDTYFIDNQCSDRRESISCSTSGENMIRKETFGNGLQYTRITPPCTISSEDLTMQQSTTERVYSGNQLWSEFSQQCEGERTDQCESFLGIASISELHQSVSTIANADLYNENESSLSESSILASQKNTHNYWNQCHKIKEEKPYQCAICRKSFIRKDYLITHERTHTGERPFQCAQCEKCFSLKKYLVRHWRTHTGERPFQCFECDKSFNLNALLITHQRTHTGERPYQCTECLKSFCQKGHLSRHRKKHTGERPYKCTECEKSFCRKEHFIRHQKIHSGDAVRNNEPVE